MRALSLIFIALLSLPGMAAHYQTTERVDNPLKTLQLSLEEYQRGNRAQAEELAYEATNSFSKTLIQMIQDSMRDTYSSPTPVERSFLRFAAIASEIPDERVQANQIIMLQSALTAYLKASQLGIDNLKKWEKLIFEDSATYQGLMRHSLKFKGLVAALVSALYLAGIDVIEPGPLTLIGLLFFVPEIDHLLHERLFPRQPLRGEGDISAHRQSILDRMRGNFSVLNRERRWESCSSALKKKMTTEN